ncbi:Glycosyl hydrolase family 1 [Trichococcus ilyis]|uniref:Glycosyl hydrolase family 1 n=1 Tax=Trichococcus ilyis TaxID=640938 RepID=A0A143YJB3_9LACT|nr:Hypothetical protein TR210_929 [Trichococcus ilyis]SEI73456.1 Glycosyl hydrolase family 1 [Trichococcus ilyis]
MKRFYEENGIQLEITEDDLALMKHTVDYISFIYYMSYCATADEKLNIKVLGNVKSTVMNPYLEASAWDGKSIRKDCAMP